jgi:hypothetical protein
MLGGFLFHCSILSKVGASEKTGAIQSHRFGLRFYLVAHVKRQQPLDVDSCLSPFGVADSADEGVWSAEEKRRLFLEKLVILFARNWRVFG